MRSETGTNVCDEPDEFVPDPKVCAELGITPMSLWRYDQDRMLGFPPKIKIRTRNYRSRRMLEAWKKSMLRRAVNGSEKRRTAAAR